MRSTLRFSAGNFYINDKPTGAVVGKAMYEGEVSWEEMINVG